MTHDLKVWPEFFQVAKDGAKTFEVRHTTDREFKVDDIVVLSEWDPATRNYTGRVLRKRITYVFTRDHASALFTPTLLPDFVIFSLTDVEPRRTSTRPKGVAVLVVALVCILFSGLVFDVGMEGTADALSLIALVLGLSSILFFLT